MSKEKMLNILRQAMEQVEKGYIEELYVIGIDGNGSVSQGLVGNLTHLKVATELIVERRTRQAQVNMMQ